MTLELGGNIALEGFNEVGAGEMVVVKKLVGRYARKLSDISDKYAGLKVTMKQIHATDKSAKHEIHAKLLSGGSPVTARVVDRNLFICIDSVLKKILSQIEK